MPKRHPKENRNPRAPVARRALLLVSLLALAIGSGHGPRAEAFPGSTPPAAVRLVTPEIMEPPVVSAAYPGGNVIVERIDGDTVYLRQDLRGTAGWWFYWNFEVANAGNRTLTFQFTNKDPIGVEGPAFSTDGGQTWGWLGTGSVRSASFSYTFGDPPGPVRFCFAIPYVETDLLRFLGKYARHPNLRIERLNLSRQGRPVERLRFGQVSREPSYRVLLTARHHACESIAGYVLEGIIEHTLADGEDGLWLRRNVEIAALPFMDKDGVEDGDQGKNRIPHDHNRDYTGKSIYPSVQALRRFAPEWSNGKLAVALDLHCPYIRGEHNEVIYMVGVADQDTWQQQRRFSAILENAVIGPLPFRAEDDLPFGVGWNTAANYKTGKSASRWATSLNGVKLAGTLEIPYARAGGVTVTKQNARAFGHDLARALRRYLETDLGHRTAQEP